MLASTESNSTPFKMNELKKQIKKLNNKVTAGNNCNLLLKKCPVNVNEAILQLCNKSLELGQVPIEWKKSEVKMLKKNPDTSKRPKAIAQLASPPASAR